MFQKDRNELKLKDILLAAQVAILGMITPNMRGIAIGWEEGLITLRIYFEVQPSEEEIELMEMAGTELFAYLPSDEVAVAEEYLINNTESAKNLNNLNGWIYFRYEGE